MLSCIQEAVTEKEKKLAEETGNMKRALDHMENFQKMVKDKGKMFK